tara:strand:- start:3158 stop:3340 length:183 start_codon:yes stop_codon:yes gene_type:complete
MNECSLCGVEIDPQRDKNGRIFWKGGHNAFPLKEGRCCTKCNKEKVIPARIDAMACQDCD